MGTPTTSEEWRKYYEGPGGLDRRIDNCPFCGKWARVIHIEGSYGIPGEYVVSCPTGDDSTISSPEVNPVCPGFRFSFKRGQPGSRKSYEEAVQAWNWKEKLKNARP